MKSFKEAKGLWHNIHAKRARGEKPNPPGHPDRPTAADFKRSQTKEEVDNSSIEEAWKKAGPNGEIEMSHKGQRYKIEKQLDHNERHTGEYKIYVHNKRNDDWDWHNTVRGKSYAKELVDQLKENNSKEEVTEMKGEWKTSTPWHKPEKVKKDKFGNVIKDKNYAKYLAKAAAKKSTEVKKEDVNKLDEISQDKLRQYHGKAGADLNAKKDKVAKGELSFADLRKGQNRVKGLNRAASKMEEAEKIDEISKKTLGSYIKKASDDAARKASDAMQKSKEGDHVGFGKQFVKSRSRNQNIAKAVDKLAKESVEQVDEARGTSAKYADKSGILGGKYTSHDHMMGMKNFSQIRKKRQDQKHDAHMKQDPKMAKMGYAKHMLDTDKADAKAKKRGINPDGQYDKYKKANNIKDETIPDGKTAMTKRPDLTKSDADKLMSLKKMMDKERENYRKKIDEVLDRPGALDSYRKKADASGNKARNSATRKILTAPKNGERPDHSAELNTMRKRNKGQDMADRVSNRHFRKSIGQPYINKD